MPNTNLEVETKQFHAFLYYFMVEVKLIRTMIHTVSFYLCQILVFKCYSEQLFTNFFVGPRLIMAFVMSLLRSIESEGVNHSSAKRGFGGGGRGRSFESVDHRTAHRASSNFYSRQFKRRLRHLQKSTHTHHTKSYKESDKLL